MIDANKILLINCSYPNYNLAIEKMKVFYGDRCKEGRSVTEIFSSDCDGVCLSAIFSWDVPFMINEAKIALSQNKKVMLGGGGTQQLQHYIEKETGLKPNFKPVLELENVNATFKSVYFTRGCSESCWFCTVPRIEGRIYTMNYLSNPAPVLMDNNLAGAPQEMQEYVVEKYLSANLRIVDVNSGYEPKGINDRTVQLFNQLPMKYWRIGFDEIGEEAQVIDAIRKIKEYSKKKIRVYTMFGHEPYEQCKYRCDKVIELGCEPVPQAKIALNAKSKTPDVAHDWTMEKLKDFQRFYYTPYLYRKISIEEYAPRINSKSLFAI